MTKINKFSERIILFRTRISISKEGIESEKVDQALSGIEYSK